MSIGCDNLAINQSLLLHLTFEEMTGLLAHDRAKPVHEHTLHGVPTWNSLANGLPYLDFDAGNPDWLDCPIADTGDLDFTAGDFSGAIWLNRDIFLAAQTLLCRGAGGTGGWKFYLDASSYLQFVTYQAASSQTTGTLAGTSLIQGYWYMISFSRSGTSIRIYRNGIDVTNPQVHVNPVAVNMELHIGVDNNETDDPYDGKIAGGPCGPHIWGRSLSSYDHRYIWNTERHWLGA